MIPLTPEAREGIAQIVATIRCSDPARRSPEVAAALELLEQLPDRWEECTLDVSPPYCLGCQAREVCPVLRERDCPLCNGGGLLLTGYP